MVPYAEVFAFSPSIDLMKYIPTANTPITTRLLELAENFLTEKNSVWKMSYRNSVLYWQMIVSTATVFMLVCVFFSFFSHIESLSSSTTPFTVKPKRSFLLTFSIIAIQHMMKKHINLSLKHDCEIPELNTNLNNWNYPQGRNTIFQPTPVNI